MRYLNLIFVIFLTLILTSACDEDQIIPGTGMTDELYSLDAKKGAKENPLKATGSVELTWKGADKGSNKGNKPEELLTFLDVVAIEGTVNKDPKGEIVYTVLETDLSLHREIIAKVLDVKIAIEGSKKKAYVVAMVISDSKGCAGDGHSGHDDACGGSSDDDSSHDGGCSHDDSDEGGCSDDHTDEGGCSHDTDEGSGTHDDSDEGGCSDDHTDEGGCSGSDAGSDTHGGSPGGADKGNPLSGKNCRTGQIIALKMHDGGSPGMSRDGITWKWFNPEASFVPAIGNRSDWPHLCKKEIIGGNLVVHIK